MLRFSQKYYALIIVLVLLTSCAKRSYVGVYKKSVPFYNASLTIKEDSTFLFEESSCTGYNIAFGKWTRDHNGIILNSDNSGETIEELYSDTIDDNRIELFITDLDNSPIEFALYKLTLKNKKIITGYVLEDGRISIQSEHPPDTILIQYIHRVIVFHPQYSNSNIYKIQFNPYLRDPIVNEKWHIKRRRAILKNANGYKFVMIKE
jgi:hypothetical protein